MFTGGEANGPLSRASLRMTAGWWVADLLGATLFAACISAYLGRLTGSGGPGPLWLLGGVALSGGLRAAAQGLATARGLRAALSVKRAMRHSLFAALLPTGLARGRLVGEDSRTAIDDVEAGEAYVAHYLPLRIAAVAGPLVVAAIVAWASWVSALILLLTLMAFLPGIALAGLAARAESERQFAALSRLNGLFVDRVRSLPIILAFGVEDRIARQLGASAREVADRTIRVLRVAFLSSAVMEFFAALSVALVAVYCGFALLGLLPFAPPERLTFARALFALVMAPEFYLGMRRLAAAYHDKQQGEAAARTIGEQLDKAKATRVPCVGNPIPVAELAVDALVIAFPDGNRLGPFTARWRGPGLHAIVGETGSGKSSLLHALLGMVPVASGEVLANGAPFVAGSFNRSIGWAGQMPLLLPGTVRDNLLLGAGNAAQSGIDAMIARFGLSGLIRDRGLELPVDSRGSGLSGGERRRIGLVRAALSSRSVLLLDEPTADLDADSREKVLDALAELARHSLVVAATHDPSLIARADSRLVLA